MASQREQYSQVYEDTLADWETDEEIESPNNSACYMLTAQKRVSTLTPVRPVWSKKPKVVAGLAEPSTRISRIRFDQNS